MENDDIQILDLGLKGNFGTPGWSSPEHEELREELIESLPLSSDVFILGLWIKRLFPSSTPYSTLAKQCLEKDNKKRPNAQHVYKEVQSWSQPVLYKRLFWVAFGFLLMFGLGWFVFHKPDLEKRFPENGISLLKAIKEGKPADRRSRLFVQSVLNDIAELESEKYIELRKNLIKWLSLYYGEIQEKYYFSGNVDDIRAICVGPGTFPEMIMILYLDRTGHPSWTPLGSMVNESQFLSDIKFIDGDIHILLEDMDGGEMDLQLPEYPYGWERDPKQNILFLYESNADDVLNMILRGENEYKYVAKDFQSRLRGVICFSDYENLLDKLTHFMEGRLQVSDQTIYLSGECFERILSNFVYVNFSHTSSEVILKECLKSNNLELRGDVSCLPNYFYKGFRMRDVYWLDIVRDYCLGDCTFKIEGDSFIVSPPN